MSHLMPRVPNAQAIQALGDHLSAINRTKRRQRSLQTCHRPAHRRAAPEYRHASGAYVPQFSARVLNDPRLSDGARRCAIKLMELAYRKARSERAYHGTVSYLARSMRRSERAVQYYLAQLRAGGYIRHEVVQSAKARMCVGVVITLLAPLFPKHHAKAWPVTSRTSGVQKDSEKYRSNKYQSRGPDQLGVQEWALRCMDGVYRALVKTDVIPSFSAPVPAG